MSIIRRAVSSDIDAVTRIFEHIHDEEEKGRITTGWVRGVYPTRETAELGVRLGDLFVMEEDGSIIAAMRLNKEQPPAYASCAWEHSAPDDLVMVMHTLVVEPAAGKHGCGRQMVELYERFAAQNGCPFLRIDTNARNTRARAMYKKLGYRQAGVVPCIFNGIEGVELVCIEKKLELEPLKPGKYRHFKGKEYELICTATHSETMEQMVVYRALYGQGGVWVRPAAMWSEEIERDGKLIRRFSYIGE